MLAMTLPLTGQSLLATNIAVPAPGEHDVLIKVLACGVCRTDLHLIDGELAQRRPGLVPGHEIVGRVVCCGSQATRIAAGARIGVPWLGGACAQCRYCLREQEKTCVMPPCLPATTAMADLRSTRWPMNVFALRCLTATTMRTPRRCYALA